MAEVVHYEVEGPVATLTLDAPHNRNALSRQLVTELFAGVDRAEADDEVKVVVLTSAGTVFCSGADLSEASGRGMEEGTRRIVELQRRIVASPKPFVSRVTGAVRAGGIGIVASTDIAVASTTSTYALTEVRLGLAAATISLTVLPRMTSRAAARTFLTGETFDGRAAAAIGLVTLAVPESEVGAEVSRIVTDLCKGHPQGLRETKGIVNREVLAGFERDGEAMAELSSRLFASDAARETMLAFLDRRG